MRSLRTRGAAPAWRNSAPSAAAASSSRSKVARSARSDHTAPLAARSHWLLGQDPSGWIRHVPHFERIVYGEATDDVQLRFRTEGAELAFELELAAGLPLGELLLRCHGQERMTVTDSGELRLRSETGAFRFGRPRAFQVEANGRERELPCRYVRVDEERFGFSVEGHDSRRPLRIDPPMLWASYLGGTRLDHVLGVDFDAKGMVTVAGSSDSLDFPTTPGAFQAPDHPKEA